MRKFVSFGLMFTLMATLCTGDDEIRTYLDHGKPKIYGDAVVKKIVKVDAIYSFSCDVTGWPAIIGQNIPVHIAGITLPEIVTEDGKPNKFFQSKLRQRLKTILAVSSEKPKIELKKIRRADTFGLIADVIVDSNSLADILIDEGFARKIEDLKKTEYDTIEKQSLLASKTSKIFHKSTCRHAKSMDPAKALTFTSTQQAIKTGRRPCKTCKP